MSSPKTSRRSMRRRGEGTIVYHKRIDRWVAALTIGYYANGNPRRRTKNCKTEPEAIAALAEMVVARDRGTLIEPSRVTVAEWLEQWLDGKHHLSSRTKLTYQYSIDQVNEVIGRERLQRLAPSHVRQMVDGVARAGFAVSTQRKALMILKAALEEALELEVITRNPAAAVRIRAPRVEQETATAWDAAEVQAFLAAAESNPHYPVFYLMLSLGLRRGEALGLAWKYADLPAGVVRIRQAYTLDGKAGAASVKPVKTPQGRRSLHLSHDVIVMLEGVKSAQVKQRGLLHDLWENTGLVFTTRNGTPIHPRNLGRSFSRILDAATIDRGDGPEKLRRIRLHDLRHTYASLALRRGIPAEMVSERLGHASVGFTLDTYRHMYEAERKEAALSLADLMMPRGALN